jgi:osmotically-inducible protein OsmY
MAVDTRSSEDIRNQTVGRLDRDGRIADSLITALELSIPDDAGSIDVRVSYGEVTLSGTVSTLLAFRIAQRIAESTPGTVAVDNDLEIR